MQPAGDDRPPARAVRGVSRSRPGPAKASPIIRGLKGSEVLHLVDGMRLNMTFFRNSPSQYIALVDPYNIDQIELLRGPAGTLYGSDAMGGVLQVLTPEERFTGEEWQYDARSVRRSSAAPTSRRSVRISAARWATKACRSAAALRTWTLASAISAMAAASPGPITARAAATRKCCGRRRPITSSC